VRGAGVQLAKGAALILVAIVIGIVLLQVVDDGEEGAIDANEPRPTTTTTGESPSSTQPTTASTAANTQPARDPSEVAVLVLNAGAPTGAAGTLSGALRDKGYTNQPVDATDWTGADHDATAVFCKPNFGADAAALAAAVQEGLQPEAWPDPPPPQSDTVDCVVAVGG
jgi:hypothetical protein